MQANVYQAITTKYLAPTNFKGARIKAQCDAASLTLPYPHEHNGSEAHRHVAEALAEKLDWLQSGNVTYAIYGGSLPKGNRADYAWVIVRQS
jgi:hypothetical protein